MIEIVICVIFDDYVGVELILYYEIVVVLV